MKTFQKIRRYLNDPFYPSTTTNVHHSPEVCKDQPAKGGCWRQAIKGKQAPAQGGFGDPGFGEWWPGYCR